jgi:endonuclease/exonuclease/phosphatase family metal-dependent hydrolase
MRIATFNLENFDDEAGQDPSLATRVAIMGPQLERVAADVLCLQEVHSQDSPQGRTLAALDSLLAGTSYQDYQRLTTTTTGGDLYQERNLVILSRFPLVDHPGTIIRDSSGPRPAYQVATANPPDHTADPLEWERPILYAQVDLGGGRILHVMNLHLKSKIATDIQGARRWTTSPGGPPQPGPKGRSSPR